MNEIQIGDYVTDGKNKGKVKSIKEDSKNGFVAMVLLESKKVKFIPIIKLCKCDNTKNTQEKEE